MSSENRMRHGETYWCYECDTIVSLSSSSSPSLICPQCHGDFIEQMQNPNPNNSNSRNSPRPLPTRSFPQTLTLTLSSSDSVSDRNFESHLDRLIQRISDREHSHHRTTPASKSSIESIPTVKITTSDLASDSLFCPICKDEFVINVEAKKLPCNHIYHSDCIMPWLSGHNSCPVCRFRLPTDKPEHRRPPPPPPGPRRRVVSIRFGNIMEEREEDLSGMRSRMRNIRRLIHVRSPTQIGRAETSSSGDSNSGESVSSFPARRATFSGDGGLDDDGDTVMSEIRGDLDDEGDTIMSEIRGLFS
ncbi:uncharacterized protein LOC143863859 [Tasmannia lanceolata]|uniref:uncharacterized protein LOC143863859 n=1 Tax=Tasmannia lanceolata TaxID=3420 RepID=UPI00406488BB